MGSCTSREDALEELRGADVDLQADLEGVQSLLNQLIATPVEDISPAEFRRAAHVITESLAFNMVRVFSTANWVEKQHGIQVND